MTGLDGFTLSGVTGWFDKLMRLTPKPLASAMLAGVFYLFIGLFGVTVAGLFTAFPVVLILAIAGLALLGTIDNSLAVSLSDEAEREAAFITFLVTA